VLDQDLCASEVNELKNSAGWIQKQVLGLDISVTDSLGVDVCEGAEELVDVELDLQHWHCRLHLVEVARCSVDGFRNVFKNKVQVDFVSLSSALVGVHSNSQINGHIPDRRWSSRML
jgi:hypothetical protein